LTTTPESHQRYLKHAFQLNPVWRAADVIDLRARALKKTRLDNNRSKEELANVGVLRQAAKAQIATLQREFWKLPLTDLKRQLESLDVRKLPELAPVVNRLRTAAACRGEFPRLMQESWMDAKLFEAFKTAVVLPPVDAGAVRERFLSRVTNKNQLKKLQAAVKKMATEFPVLYALEADWFQTIKGFKLQKVESEFAGVGGSADFDWSGMGWPVWLLIFIVIRVLIRVVSMSGQ
jgi:hypothetical protein